MDRHAPTALRIDDSPGRGWSDDAVPTTAAAGPSGSAGTDAPPTITGPIESRWLGRIDYRDAWALQHRLAAERADDRIADQLILLEHPAVLTLGRHADEAHVRADAPELARRGIELIRVERGGEVTYHGPGQLVAYPILALSRRGLLLRPLVRALEAAMVETCAAFGVGAGRRDGHPGCWIDPDGASPRKIGALGIRVERGVTYHGIALNIAPDLRDFELIDPCGMPDVTSTSIAAEAGWSGAAADPGSTVTRRAVARAAGIFAAALARNLDAPLVGELPGA
jgi:lipoyl(octanoyl) transferase